MRRYGLAHKLAAGTRRQRHVEHVRFARVFLAKRVPLSLENGAHQHALVVVQDVFTAIAVVDVEVISATRCRP